MGRLAVSGTYAPLRRDELMVPGAATRARMGVLGLSDGTNQASTYRTKHVSVQSCFEPELVWGNFYNNSGAEADGNATITVKASLEGPDGTLYPCFSQAGLRTITIEVGGTGLLVAHGARMTKGEVWFVRTYVTVAVLGSKWPLAQTMSSAAAEGFDTTDKTDTGTVTPHSVGGFGPQAIYGHPIVDTPPPAFVIVGDSIVDGTGDTTANAGMYELAVNGNFMVQYLSWGSDAPANWSDTPYSRRRRPLMEWANVAIMQLGLNGLGATTQAKCLSIWQSLANRGLRVYAVTLPPRTTSTDNWQTTGAQTVAGTETNRTAYNDYVRSVPAPLSGFIEIADSLEVDASNVATRNGGRWKCAAALHNVSAAVIATNVATITTSDAHGLSVNDNVAVAGVSATFNGVQIVTAVGGGGTTFNFAKVAGDITLGAGGTASTVYAKDGIHPSHQGHVLAAVPIAAFFAANAAVSA